MRTHIHTHTRTRVVLTSINHTHIFTHARVVLASSNHTHTRVVLSSTQTVLPSIRCRHRDGPSLHQPHTHTHTHTHSYTWVVLSSTNHVHMYMLMFIMQSTIRPIRVTRLDATPNRTTIIVIPIQHIPLVSIIMSFR